MVYSSRRTFFHFGVAWDFSDVDGLECLGAALAAEEEEVELGPAVLGIAFGCGDDDEDGAEPDAFAFAGGALGPLALGSPDGGCPFCVGPDFAAASAAASLTPALSATDLKTVCVTSSSKLGVILVFISIFPRTDSASAYCNAYAIFPIKIAGRCTSTLLCSDQQLNPSFLFTKTEEY